MKWRRDARDKRHFIIMSAVAALVLVIGLFFDQNGEQAVETSGTQTVTVREGAVTDAAVMAAPISESAVQAAATPSPEDGIYTYLQDQKSEGTTGMVRKNGGKHFMMGNRLVRLAVDSAVWQIFTVR